MRTLSVDDWRQWRDLRLAALSEAPEAFDSRLADWRDAGEPRWRARLADVPLHLIADLDGRPAGMVSCTAPDSGGMAELLSMWVAPFARGSGIGDALVDAVVRWAGEQGAGRIMLHVMKDNVHAAALYERCGFADAGEAPTGEDEPGVRIMVREPGAGRR